MKLYIGNRAYSSWSMRPWPVLKAFEIPFTDEVIRLGEETTATEIAKVSPSGRVPVLHVGDGRIWDALAIIEYLAETFPDNAIWPKGKAARAHARCVSNEMHSSFFALRNACPMNLRKTTQPRAWPDEVLADLARIEKMWVDARAHFGAEGQFLYGHFSAADAMFAPVVTRILTYHLPVSPATLDYCNAVMQHPAIAEWVNLAKAEPWFVTRYE